MMRRLAFLLLALSVAACGVERPLLKPSQIPAAEAARQRKRDKIAQEEADQQQQDAADAAGEKAIEDAQ